MGNRCVIPTPQRKVGLYLHWNGGRDTVEPLLRYCELKGYRPPSADDYGWARICQVMGNFFGGTTPVGIGAYSDDARMDPGDNWEAYPVVGFGQPSSNRIAVWADLPDGKKDVTYPDLPSVARLDHDGD